jgi:hypothetical protein
MIGKNFKKQSTKTSYKKKRDNKEQRYFLYENINKGCMTV